MSLERLITKLNNANKQDRHLLSAKCWAYASFTMALPSIPHFAERHWLLALMYAGIAVYVGCLAFAQYALSRKASGE